MSDPHCPVVVAGGGLVGSAFALSLARAGVPVQLVDARRAADDDPRAQRRPIAVSAASVHILVRLGVWGDIAERAQAINSVHVSERGRFGRVHMRAAEHGLDALGYVTDAATIEAVLARALARESGVRRQVGTASLDTPQHPDRVHVQVSGAGPVAPARLLVVADGASSALRACLGLDGVRREYAQQAVVCNVQFDGAHHGVAYERFLDSGPLALLPLLDGRCALVWTLPERHAPGVAALPESAFIDTLTSAFGHRLGRFTGATRRQCFALAGISAARLHAHRGVCIGNAANQLHPVAGQGLNLGLRDAATLAELVAHAHERGDDPGDGELLARFAALRRADHRTVVAFTDMLARGFSLAPRWLGPLRSLALLGLQLTPPARQGLARIAMGLRPPVPHAASHLEP